MTYYIICPICGKLYQDWGGIRSKDEVERSFRGHLTGKHCLSGEAFKKAYEKAKRKETSE